MVDALQAAESLERLLNNYLATDTTQQKDMVLRIFKRMVTDSSKKRLQKYRKNLKKLTKLWG